MGDSSTYPGLDIHAESINAYETDLDRRVGRLKQAAIDAYMCHGTLGMMTSFIMKDGGDITTADGFFKLDEAGGRYTISVFNRMYMENSTKLSGSSLIPPGMVDRGCWTYKTFAVTRPDGDGKNGGRTTLVSTTYANGDVVTGDEPSPWGDFTVEFNRVQTQIEGLLEPWLTLPHPDYIEDVAKAFEDFTRALQVDGGDLSVLRTTLVGLTEVDALQGETIRAFQNTFSNKLGPVLEALSGVAAHLTAHLQAQVGLWGAARLAFIDIVDAHTEAFAAMSAPDASPFTVEVAIRVLQYAASALSVGNIAGFLRFGADTLSLATFAKAEASKQHSSDPSTYEAGVRGLGDGLKSLQDDIYVTEERIRETVAENILHIGSTGEAMPSPLGGTWNQGVNHRATVDLFTVVGQEDSYDGFEVSDPSKIAMCGAAVASIVTQIGLFSDALVEPDTGIGPKIVSWDDDISLTVQRDDRIGLGTYGPSWMLREYNEVLVDLIGTLAEDCQAKGNQFQAAYQYHVAGDDTSRAALQAANQEICTGGPGRADPWDYHVPVSRDALGREKVAAPRDSTPTLWGLRVLPDPETDLPRPPLTF